MTICGEVLARRTFGLYLLRVNVTLHCGTTKDQLQDHQRHGRTREMGIGSSEAVLALLWAVPERSAAVPDLLALFSQRSAAPAIITLALKFWPHLGKIEQFQPRIWVKFANSRARAI